MGTENILGVPRDLGVGKGLIRKEMHKEILGVVVHLDGWWEHKAALVTTEH